MKRVFIGGFHHESDTFNPIITGRDDIIVRRGEELLLSTREDSVRGLVSYLKEKGYSLILSLHARAVPNGEWDRNCYLELKKEFLSSLQENLPFDGIALALHGSMRVREIGSAEEDILSAVREICPETPISVVCDMHATITPSFLSYADSITGYKCAPHTDTLETGRAAASVLDWMLTTGLKPETAAYHIPFLVAGEKSETSVEPMLSIMNHVREIEKDEDVLSSSLLMGFPWADTPSGGVTAVVITKGDEEKARMYSKAVADEVWSRRDEFRFCSEACEMDEAITAAENNTLFPLVLSDSGDNPTAGSSQDVTVFLKKLMASSLSSLDPPVLYQGFYDPEIVREAFRVGEGGRVKGLFGSKFDAVTSTPLPVDAPVKAVASYAGFRIALLSVGGIDTVVTEKHVGCYDVGMMRALTPCVENRKIIVVKLGYLEPEIRAISSRSILVLTPGSTNEVFERLEYRNLKRPVYPLDDASSLGITRIK